MIVHCKTQEQWDKVTEINGIEFSCGEWGKFKDNSCINTLSKKYEEYSFFKNSSIYLDPISFEEYMATLNKDVEYKVGDVVKIREDLEVDHYYENGVKFISAMLKYTGKEARLTEEVKGYGFSIDLDYDLDCTWSPDMFECKIEEVKEKESQKETTLSLSELGCDLEELGEIIKEVGDLEVALEDKLGQAEKLISKYGLDISMDDYRRNNK